MKVQSIIISVFLVLLSTGCEKIPIPDSYYSYLEDTEVANYTKIYTADDLAAIANNLSGSYLLMNDIDLSNYGDWGSIGGYSGEFTGVFNGGDNTISNLNGSNGLFGRIKDANISNIILENPNIKGSSFVGGIVGSAENSYIISCAVIGGSIASTSTTSSYVGGIAGSLGCDIDDKTAMVGCYSSSTVSGNDDPVGGLVGSCIYPLIVGCYSVGDVHSNGEDVGNVAGSASNTQACYYVKHADSNLDIGVANLSGNATSVTLSVLNSTAVSAMNSAISDSGYSSVKYTAGSPSNEYLPSLMGEKVTYIDLTSSTDEDDSVDDTTASTDETENVIEIYTADDLAAIANNLSGNYLLMNDIDLSNYGDWGSIGSYSNKFSGAFNGGGYTISELQVSSASSYQGFFGYADGATIKNVVFKDASVSGDKYVGVLVGFASTTTINNCIIDGGEISGSGSSIGGVVGYSQASSFLACYNTSSVTGSYQVGGIVGYLGSSSASITACYNTGSIMGSGAGGSVGGIAGISITTTTGTTPSITACYNTGSVSSNSSNDYTGGVLGKRYSTTITACYYIDQADDDATSGVGGSSSTDVIATTIVELNEKVSEMNSAISDAGYSNVKYTAGSSTDKYLPSLMGEQISYGVRDSFTTN